MRCIFCDSAFNPHAKSRHQVFCSGRCRSASWARKNYAENPEIHRRNARKWYSNNSTICIERSRNYRKRNPEKVKSTKALWEKSYPEKVKKYKANSIIRIPRWYCLQLLGVKASHKLNVPEILIEAKRQQVRLTRAIK